MRERLILSKKHSESDEDLFFSKRHSKSGVDLFFRERLSLGQKTSNFSEEPYFAFQTWRFWSCPPVLK